MGPKRNEKEKTDELIHLQKDTENIQEPEPPIVEKQVRLAERNVHEIKLQPQEDDCIIAAKEYLKEMGERALDLADALDYVEEVEERALYLLEAENSLEEMEARILMNLAVSYTHLTLPTILLVQISVVAVSLKKKNLRHKKF
eukprot:TRINITY_DN32890_c0_g1_i1.p2 TRINITY_DN32890_c0_g1~~TRINITY_DN32890_c0_g1_i1.p2  ORF type:complete len:143 (-),score=47.10 TRINITY_DN32890_c0_g1_i1:39-467(-)